MKQEPIVTKRDGNLIVLAGDDDGFGLRITINERTLEVKEFMVSYPAPLKPEEYEKGFIPNP